MLTLAAVAAAVPGALGVTVKVVKSIGEHSRYERTKRALTILKMKYEIEAIRRKNHLEFPELIVDPKEIERIQIMELPWSDPRRSRSSLWDRYVNRGRKRNLRVMLAASGFFALLCFGGALTTILAATSDDYQSSEGILRLLIVILDTTIGYLVLRTSIRLYYVLRMQPDQTSPDYQV